ncbi:MAG TPA: BlaI/MecI/CopY family transcriptional regulator [Terriglobia bacterium]|nr:BlaI/MecI/CopY family transcriptional regulator [Terriglobia bacterium]
MKNKKPVLTDQELEIMKIVWQRGSATVREVYEELLKRRRIAYTTVMTMMGILEQKGRLKKSEEARAYVYTPSEPQGKVVGSMVQEFVKRVFNGSAEPLLVHLLENQQIDGGQLDEIRDLLAKRKLLAEKPQAKRRKR